MISLIAMVKPAQASGTVNASPLYFGGNNNGGFHCIGLASLDAVKGCEMAKVNKWLADDLTGLNGNPNVLPPEPLSCPTAVLTDFGPSGGYVDVFKITYYRGAVNAGGFWIPVYYKFCNGPYVGNYAIYTQSACPANSTPTGSTCTCNDPYLPDAAGTSCVPGQYRIELKTSVNQVEPSKTVQVIATVKDMQDNGINGVTVNIKVDVDAGSGGHDHDEGRHVPPYTGVLSAATGITGPDGSIAFIFGAPEVSGTHTFTVACVSVVCTNNPATTKIDVKVDKLSTLTASPDFELVGTVENRHTDNHWLAAQAKTNLLKIVNKYNAAYPDGPLLRLNDASLIWGGKFDISGHWTGDHKEHRRGEAIDIRANQFDTAIPEARFKDFQRFANQSGGASANLHCNPPYSLTCPGCILDNRPNRHFHVYLLGK